MSTVIGLSARQPWNKGKLVGQKRPLKLREIWAIRIRLQINLQHRELAMFNLVIDSKLRACDLVNLRGRDITNGSVIQSRAMVLQQKTQTPVRFELMEQTREALSTWHQISGANNNDYLFPNRTDRSNHITTRQYARTVKHWVTSIGLEASATVRIQCGERSSR